MTNRLKRAARWLLPWYWAHRYVTPRWIVHDCAGQPIICRLECVTRWDWGADWGFEDD